MLAASRAKAAGRQFTEASLDGVLSAYRSALFDLGTGPEPELWAVPLADIGHTYLDAAQGGVGDLRGHVENAIDALGRAAQIAPESGPDAWLRATRLRGCSRRSRMKVARLSFTCAGSTIAWVRYNAGTIRTTSVPCQSCGSPTPAESTFMVTLVLIGESPDGELGFRIESAEEWEQHVQPLNSAAIFPSPR
jgi:hypothetical protein